MLRLIALALSLSAAATAVCANQTSRSKRPARAQSVKVRPVDPPIERTGDSYKIGNRSVIVPAPEGFEEVTARFEQIGKYFTATEVAGNEFLAAHYPVERIAQIKLGTYAPPNLYTKVSIPRMLKEFDVTEQDFDGMIAVVNAEGAKLFDPNQTVMKEALVQMEKNLGGLSGTTVNVDLAQPKFFGEFYRTKNTHAALMLMKLKIGTEGMQSETPVLCGAGLVRVNKRVLFAFMYKRFDSADAADTLRELTKQWLDKIVAANKG